MESNFKTKPWTRNPHMQTIFSSLKIRATGGNPMVDCAEEIIVDGGDVTFRQEWKMARIKLEGDTNGPRWYAGIESTLIEAA